MSGDASQGNSSQGQEPGAGTQGQGQEPDQSGQQNGTQGQEPGSGGQAQGGQQQGAEQAPDFATMSEADLRSYAAKLHKDAGEARREAASFRTRATTAEGKITEAERAAMTEQQRVATDLETAQTTIQEKNSRISELETKLDDLVRGGVIREALGLQGALNAGTAFRLGDWSGVKLTDDGKLDTNDAAFKAEVDKLRKSDPYLFRRGASADAGQGRDSSPSGGTGNKINDLIRGA